MLVLCDIFAPMRCIVYRLVQAVSVREYLKTNGFSEAFARCYLVPMAAALWSSTAADVMGHSALAMISFLHNHQMLQVTRGATHSSFRVYFYNSVVCSPRF